MKNVDNKHKAHRNDKMASRKSSKVSAILIGIIVLAALVFSIVAPNQFNSLYEAIIGRPAEIVSHSQAIRPMLYCTRPMHPHLPKMNPQKRSRRISSMLGKATAYFFARRTVKQCLWIAENSQAFPL